VALHGISSFCYGLVFPDTAIFLADQPGIGTSGVAFYYAASGAAGLAVAMLLALGVVRPPRVALGLTGNALSCVGYLLLPTVGSLPGVILAAIAVGAGQGCFLAAIIPIVSSMVSESDTRRVFALRYQVLNATLALGSLVAGGLTSVLSPDVIPYLFLVNAVGYLPIAAALLLTRKAGDAGQAAREAEQSADGDGTGGALSMRLLLRASLGVVLFELVIALFAYSQFESTAPLVAYQLMGTGLGWIPAIIAVNVVVVVAAQHSMTRALERRSDVFGLRAAVVLWVAGYLLVAASAFLPPTFRLAGLLAYAVMFGLGECAYSCSYYSWMIAKVPDRELTRITALTNGMMGIGMFAGPAIGVSLVTTGSAAVVWLSLAAMCSVAALTTVTWRTRQRRAVAQAQGVW
jgi:MFS family permease